MKQWNPHDAKKHKAHKLALEIWPWTDKRERNKMYGWIDANKDKWGGKQHIRHMTMDELSMLIFHMGKLKEKIDAREEREKLLRGGKYLKERPWLRRFAAH